MFVEFFFISLRKTLHGNYGKNLKVDKLIKKFLLIFTLVNMYGFQRAIAKFFKFT